MPENVMLAKTYTPGKTKLDFPVLVQPKVDGIRAIWNPKDKTFLSRNNKPLLVPKVQEVLEQMIMPQHLSLDGELLIPNKTFNESAGIIRRQTDGPEKDDVIYIVFDILTTASMNIQHRLFSVKILLLDYYDNFTYYGNRTLAFKKVMLLDTLKAPDETSIQALHEHFLDRGFEGIIIRKLDRPYEFKRSDALLKWKHSKKVVATINGFEEGTGRLEGTLGSLWVCIPRETDDPLTEPDAKFYVGSGLSDSIRDLIWSNQGDYLGTRIKVVYQELSEYGVPRFPRFKGFVK